jgi:hypothetical protein
MIIEGWPMQAIQKHAWIGLAMLLVAFAGCTAQQHPAYQGKQGLNFTPPPGWVERAREGLLPAKPGRRQVELPLPALGVRGSSEQERILVRYDRLTAGHLAWLRLSVVDLPSSHSLQDCITGRSPGPNWKAESAANALEISDHTAARIGFVGRWNDQEYVSETVAVRHGAQVYFFTASFPDSDDSAREEVRRAIASADWK